jgi:hypothetical protein
MDERSLTIELLDGTVKAADDCTDDELKFAAEHTNSKAQEALIKDVLKERVHACFAHREAERKAKAILGYAGGNPETQRDAEIDVLPNRNKSIVYLRAEPTANADRGLKKDLPASVIGVKADRLHLLIAELQKHLPKEEPDITAPVVSGDADPVGVRVTSALVTRPAAPPAVPQPQPAGLGRPHGHGRVWPAHSPPHECAAYPQDGTGQTGANDCSKSQVEVR